MVLSTVSRAAATSGPVRKCGHCKVHNGLTRDRVPTAPTAQLPVPSPGGDTLVLNAWGRDLGARPDLISRKKYNDEVSDKFNSLGAYAGLRYGVTGSS